MRRQRSAQGGVITFKEVFYTVFVGLSLGALIYMIFSYIYMNFIDPGYLESMVNLQIESSAKFMQSMPEDAMIEKLHEIEAKTRDGYTLPGMAKNFGIILVIYAIYSLILAAIMKKRPLFVSDSETIIDN